jgi:hypothetical protein
MKNFRIYLKWISFTISLRIHRYIICIILMNGMKTKTKILSENINRRENLIISFWNNFINVQNFGKLPKQKSFEIW